MRDKQELRTALRTRRRALTDDERGRRSAQAAQHLLGLAELQRARTVALYAALSDEADPAPARPPLEERGTRIALPRVHADGHLELVDAAAVATPGFRGILEPEGPPLSPDEIDVVVVPGLAFDRDGGRLGQGGGHYDRLLALLDDDITIVGFGFTFQVIEHVPVLDHDHPVDLVVTDAGVHRRDRRTGPTS